MLLLQRVKNGLPQVPSTTRLDQVPPTPNAALERRRPGTANGANRQRPRIQRTSYSQQRQQPTAAVVSECSVRYRTSWCFVADGSERTRGRNDCARVPFPPAPPDRSAIRSRFLWFFRPPGPFSLGKSRHLLHHDVSLGRGTIAPRLRDSRRGSEICKELPKC